MRLLSFSIVSFFFLLFSPELFASQDFAINFTYPDFEGDFYVSGNLSLPPGAVKSEENILVKSYSPDEEVPTLVTVHRKWADGSLLRIEVLFVANAFKKRNYVLSYGEDIKRKKTFSKTAVLPTISFFISGSPKVAENINANVGQINVRIDRSPQIFYYWHIVPIIFLILFSYFRYRRVKALYED